MGTLPTPVLTLPSQGPILGAVYLGGTGAAMYVFIEYFWILIRYAVHSACRLFGTTNLQVYFYFRNYKQDGVCQKCVVIFLWYDKTRDCVWAITEGSTRLLDTLHMTFVIVDIWHSLIDSFGNYTTLDSMTWCAIPLTCGFSKGTQSFAGLTEWADLLFGVMFDCSLHAGTANNFCAFNFTAIICNC